MKHFENVWEEAELIDPSTTEEAISSAVLKLNLYSSLSDKESKEHLFGEILFDLAKISKAENINVFKCLNKINKQKIQYLVKVAET